MKRLEVMDISHEREFKKRRSAGSQPARGQVKDTRADLRDTAQDFDLRRGGDAPTSGEDNGRDAQRPDPEREGSSVLAGD